MEEKEVFNDAFILLPYMQSGTYVEGQVPIPLPSTGTKHTPALQGLDGTHRAPVFLLSPSLFYTVS